MPVVSRPQRTEAIQAKYNVTVDFPHLGLHSAAVSGNVGLVKYALEHGQPINSVLDGVLPLHAACSGGNDHVVRLLIEKGADVNAPRLPRRYSSDKNRDGSAPIVGTSGSTPLHFACANGHAPVVLTLLMHGAHPDRADKHGTTPEMLARQNGWTACAEVLHNWILNKDRDLREKDELIPSQNADACSVIDTKHVCAGHECRTCTSKRLRVKRSIDHALNMLKPSLSQLHSGMGEYTGTALETIMASPLLPTDFAGETTLRSSPESNATINSSQRRPSLPDIFDPSQTLPMSRRSRAGSGTSSRRPRSAGNDAEQPSAAGRRVKGKVSLLSIFKKGGTDPEGSPGYASSSYTPSISSAFASPGPGTPRRSDVHTSNPLNESPVPPGKLSGQVSYADLTVQGRPRGRVFSEGEATRVPPLPTAVDLHRALSDERSRTLSSPGPADVQAVDTWSGPQLSHRSPSLRPGILRPHNRTISQQSQNDSPRSGSVGPPSSRSLRFDPPATVPNGASLSDAPWRPSQSPAKGVKMTRSTSSMRSVTGVEATRSPLRTAIEVEPPSHEGAVTDEPRDVFEDDDEEYGEPIVTREAITELDSRLSALQVTEDTKRNSLLSQGSLSPLPSPSKVHACAGFDCPFSINEPPPEDLESPTRQTFLGVNGNENRMRGDSMSSMSTNGTGGFLPTPGMQQVQLPSPWISSSTSTPPEYPTMDHGGRRRIQRAPSSTYSNDTEPVQKHKGPPSALDINVRSISSYAQAEALVQRAQRSILEMQDIEVVDPLPSGGVGTGHTPLSAKLAAYGESLAIERKFRQEEERRSSSSTVRSRRPSEYGARPLQDVFESGPGPKSLDRKFSLEERSQSRTIRQSKVRRPHTAGSTTASDILGSPSRHGRSIPSPRQFPASASQHVARSSSDQRVDDITTSYTPPVSSFLSTEVDMYPGSRPRVPRSRTPDPSSEDPLNYGVATGVPLSRIFTAPVQDVYLKPNRGLTDQERQAARATKLVKMGFSTTDALAANGVNRQQTMNKHRVGGFKGFVQSLKMK